MPRYALRINGRTHEVDAEADEQLLSVLRSRLALTGSKYGCGEGHCGACTVHLDGEMAKSCITPVGRVGSRAVTTIEGLAAGEQLHPVQQAFLEVEAFQCGYCTPGMIMAAAALLRTHPDPGEDDIARVLDRNVCRCGTFPRIVRAIRLAASRMRPGTGSAGENA